MDSGRIYGVFLLARGCRMLGLNAAVAGQEEIPCRLGQAC